MPRVALRPIDSFEQMISDNFALARGKDSNKVIGSIMGVSEGTASNRKKEPLDLSLRELFYLCQKKHIDISQFVGCKLRIGGDPT